MLQNEKLEFNFETELTWRLRHETFHRTPRRLQATCYSISISIMAQKVIPFPITITAEKSIEYLLFKNFFQHHVSYLYGSLKNYILHFCKVWHFILCKFMLNRWMYIFKNLQ